MFNGVLFRIVDNPRRKNCWPWKETGTDNEAERAHACTSIKHHLAHQLASDGDNGADYLRCRCGGLSPPECRRGGSEAASRSPPPPPSHRTLGGWTVIAAESESCSSAFPLLFPWPSHHPLLAFFWPFLHRRGVEWRIVRHTWFHLLVPSNVRTPDSLLTTHTLTKTLH